MCCDRRDSISSTKTIQRRRVAGKKPAKKIADDGGEADRSSAPAQVPSRETESATHKLSGTPSRNRERLSQTGDGSWQLVNPRCALSRQEDIAEVEQMIAAGEAEIARDELRWLLAECRDFIGAHKLLGDLAVADNDFRLARGHYGYAYQIGMKAIESAGRAIALPYRHEPNQGFFQAGRGLAICLNKLGKQRTARDVISGLMKLDPSDPMKLHALQISQGGKRGKKRR
jgi:hypothetical protein